MRKLEKSLRQLEENRRKLEQEKSQFEEQRRKQGKEQLNETYAKSLMNEYFTSKFDENRSSILFPNMGVMNFEVKTQLIQRLQNASTFGGSPLEDPNTYLEALLEICSTIKIHQVPEEVVHLRLFNFSLRDKAKSWVASRPPNSITSWEDLVRKLLSKYFSPPKSTN